MACTLKEAEVTGRRQFIQRLAATATIAGLGGSKAFAQAASPLKAYIDQAPKEMVFAGPGGDLGEIYKRWCAKFTAETGIKVNHMAGSVLDLYGRVSAERRRPSIDVFMANGPAEAQGQVDGLYQKLDPKIVVSLPEVYPIARVKDDMGVRFMFTTIGLFYNKKKYAENNIPAPRMWDDMWAPGPAGHVILSDPSGFSSFLYIAYVNKVKGGREDDPTKGIDYIASQKSKLLAVVRTSPERVALMAGGQAWITISEGSTAIPETIRNPDFGYVLPEDGLPLYWNAVCVVKGCPNPIGANLLVNYMISARPQEEFSAEAYIAPANKNAKMKPEVAKLAPDLSQGASHMVLIDQALMGASLNKYREVWNAKMGK
jgi:putative spermidine/putrescine transport system substrate-binding protein